MLFQLPDINLLSLPTGAVKDTVEALGQQIVGGSVPPGANLPREDELVEQFAVSRTVIREAIKVLSGKGIVRTARRYGSIVSPLDRWNMLDPDVIRWHGPDSPLSPKLYQDVTELRIIFEPEAAALAAQNATDEESARILTAAMGIHPDAGESAMIGADFAFHSMILRASGNMMLSQMENLIYAVLIFSYSAGRKKAPEEEVSRQNHIRVAQAIVDRSPENARANMRGMLSQNIAVARKISALAAAG